MDENKYDIANFLSEMIMQKGEDLPERWELVTGGGFSSPTDARSTRRQTVHLHGNHEEADTRLILHSCEAASEGYERLVLRCSDTDVLVLLFYFMPLERQHNQNVTHSIHCQISSPNLSGKTF